MKQSLGLTIGLPLAVTVCIISPAALAQSLPTGQTAAQNTRGGAVRSRAPGRMVAAGVARTMEAADRARAGFEIVETELPLTPRQDVLIATLETVFDELNQAILALRALLLARAGEPMATPTSTEDMTSDGTTTPTETPRGGGRR